MKTRHFIGTMSLCIPFAALEVVLVSHAPWWNPPRTTLLTWSFVVIVLGLPLALWMANGKRLAFFLTATFGAVWCLCSVGLAIHSNNIPLGFFSLALSLFWTGFVILLHRAMGRPYLNPNQKWYQGTPEPIVGLHCALKQNNQTVHLSVSRLDRDGAFLFSSQQQKILLKKKGHADLIFQFRNKEVHCRGEIAKILTDPIGAGFRFVGMTADMQKKLGDFIAVLRGEGYVP